MGDQIAASRRRQHEIAYEQTRPIRARTQHAAAPDRARPHAVSPRTTCSAESRLLPLGELESLALPGESYKLAFTPGLLTRSASRPARRSLQPIALAGSDDRRLRRTRRRRPLVDPSGRIFFSPTRDDASGRRNWRSSRSISSCRAASAILSTRQFDTESHRRSTTPTTCSLVETRDALGNIVTRTARLPRAAAAAGHRPQRQPLRGRVRALGMVVGTAVMGKAGEDRGDLLDGLRRRPDRCRRSTRFSAMTRTPSPHAILGGATTRIIYDLDRFQRTRQAHADSPRPAVCLRTSRARPTSADLAGRAADSRSRSAFHYSDGFGREIQKKIQAEPGPLVPRRTGRQPALGRQRLDHLQQQGQARPAIRAVLQPYARTDFEFDVQRRRQPDAVLRSGRARRRHAAPQPHLGKGRLRPVAAERPTMSTTRF